MKRKTRTCADINDRQGALAQTEFLADVTQKRFTFSKSAELNFVAVQESGQFLKLHRCCFVNAGPDLHHVRTWREWCRKELPTIEGIYPRNKFGNPNGGRPFKATPSDVSILHTLNHSDDVF